MKTIALIGGVETIIAVVILIVMFEKIAEEHVMIHITAVIHTYITMVEIWHFFNIEIILHRAYCNVLFLYRLSIVRLHLQLLQPL